MSDSMVIKDLKEAYYMHSGLAFSADETYDLWAEFDARDRRIAELEAEIDEFLFASSNVLNPYDGISVPYEALKKLVKRVRKERER